MITLKPPPPPGPPVAATAAVAWIDGSRAIVASTSDPDRAIELRRGPGPRSAFLARIVDAIGNAERVVILGPGDDRLALEREYVSLYRRPDRLVDVERSDPMGTTELLARLRELAG